MLGVEHLELGDRLSKLGLCVRLHQVDQGAAGIDPDLGLLQIALVVLRDPARGQVEDADDALQDDVLDPDLADLLLELSPHLLLARLALGLLLGLLGFTFH